MPSSAMRSPADLQLIDHARSRGVTVSAKQLASWRSGGLLPGNIPKGLGQGLGSTSRPRPEAFDLVIGLARHAGSGRRPSDLALLLFGERLPVPEATVRAAFRDAVSITLAAEKAALRDSDDEVMTEEERVARVADQVVASGQRVTLVPARARRIDERISRYLRERGQPPAPPQLAELDPNPAPSPLTPADATFNAVTALLTGGADITPQSLGDHFRALQPGPSTGPNPLAYLAESTFQDAPDAHAVFDPAGGFSIVPAGDVRETLRELVDTAPLDDLYTAWEASQGVQDWALELCDRVEAELDADRLGEAAVEWMQVRMLPSNLWLLSALRDRRWSPADHAQSAVQLLAMGHWMGAVDERVSGAQWDLLDLPGMLPPPLRELLRRM
ncbi:hypothetical protein [Streptomyces sp. NPDC001820]|uniref:hypothetical protein n=1 Tax=Streptomyces sp. NPDC001820 TaxID=3364613 RepID=UPI00367F6364